MILQNSPRIRMYLVKLPWCYIVCYDTITSLYNVPYNNNNTVNLLVYYHSHMLKQCLPVTFVCSLRLEESSAALCAQMERLEQEMEQERKKQRMLEIKLRNSERARQDAENRNRLLEKEMEDFFSTLGDLALGARTSDIWRQWDLSVRGPKHVAGVKVIRIFRGWGLVKDWWILYNESGVFLKKRKKKSDWNICVKSGPARKEWNVKVGLTCLVLVGIIYVGRGVILTLLEVQGVTPKHDWNGMEPAGDGTLPWWYCPFIRVFVLTPVMSKMPGARMQTEEDDELLTIELTSTTMLHGHSVNGFCE